MRRSPDGDAPSRSNGCAAPSPAGAASRPPFAFVRSRASRAERRAAQPAIIALPPPFRRNPMAQYVYTMNRVGKIVPPKRVILKDISLSFFPGAKIGVLGLERLRASRACCASWPAKTRSSTAKRCRCRNMRIGFLPQEPQLDPDETVRETVEEGLSEVLEAKQKLDAIYAAYAEPDADFDKLAAEQARYEAIIAAAGADTDVQMEIAADALRLPPWDAKVANLSGGEKRRVALCRLLLSKPDMLLLDEPTNHLDAESVDWLEQFLQRFPGTVIAVTHDRYFLDNAAEWILELDRGYGIPWKGNYSSWLEQKEARLQIEAKQEAARIKAMQKELEWVRQEREGPAGEEQGAHRALRGARLVRASEAQRDAGDLHPGRRAARRRGHRVQEREQGLRRPPADRRSVVQDSARRDRRHHRPERRRQDDAVPHDHRQREAGQGRDRRSARRRSSRSSTRRANRCRTTRRCGKRSPAGRTSSRSAGSRCRRAPISGASTSRARTSRRSSARSPAASAVGCISPPRCSRAATCCCSTSRRTTSTSRRCARSKMRSREFAGSVLVISHDRWFLDRIATHILAAEGDSQWVVLRGQLPGVRSRQEEAPRRGRRASAPDSLQGVDGLTRGAFGARPRARGTAPNAAGRQPGG